MTISTNFNVSPYYDDFSEDKKFLRMLFKPGFAVQARELTQSQTLLQKQIEKFGNHIFENGSVVTGGTTYLQDVTYLKLDTAYAGTSVTANNFIGKTIVDNIALPTKRAEVIKVFDADAGTGDPKTLLVKQLYGTAFAPADTIITSETSFTAANVATSGAGTGQIFSVDEGFYYYDGFFIKTAAQTIATNKYSNTTANARIGFIVSESVIKSTQDTSLLDPAQNASNYQAPGSDRFKIDLNLTNRALTSTDVTQFIELGRVVNGELTRHYTTPIYSVLEDTLARRTFDESGNYTVRPFKLSLATNSANTANLDITLSPGKAYVYGYEYETIAPEIITIAKPRTTEIVNNKNLSGDYGNFLYTTKHTGSLAINDLSTINLYCVPVASQNTTIGACIANTLIGTARTISTLYDTATLATDSDTYSYKTFLMDVNVNNSITGSVVARTNSTTFTIGTANGNFPHTDDAYKGATVKITAGPGANEAAKVITGYTASSNSIAVAAEDPFIATLTTASVFSINFGIGEIESLATYSGITKKNSLDVQDRSKDNAKVNKDTFLSDTAFTPPIIATGENFVAAGTIADFSYSYKRLYPAQSFVSGVSPALALGSGESLPTAATDAAKSTNYEVVVTVAGSSGKAVGKVIPVTDITTVDTGAKKITVAGAANMTANVTATINFTLASGSPAKTKTLVSAATAVQTTGGQTISSGNIVYTASGQTTIAAAQVVKTPDTAQTLYVSDIDKLVSVYDYNGSAVSNTPADYVDVTTRYTLDNGQKDSFYDHGNIKLKPGQIAPNGPLVVRYNHYSSSGAGLFTVDSYPTYGTIPVFTSPSSGVRYELRDSIDFRPVRKDATAATGETVVFDVDSTTTGPKVIQNGAAMILDFAYYLPRIDRVVLNKNRTFSIVKGEPDTNPIKPKSLDESMTLYILDTPAFLADANNVEVQYVNNRRYTMRDIGNIDSRVNNLEYYTSLSLLEQGAFDKQDLTILDTTNLPRFKNGILVDAFKGHSVADVTTAEYKASIDVTNHELRPSFNISSHGLTFDSANSTNYTQDGPFVTVASTSTQFTEQGLSSKAVNVNPFNIVNYVGKIKLNPPTDIWVDTTTKPDVLVNIGGDRDAWDLILAETNSGFDTEWGNWTTLWTGTTTNTNTGLGRRNMGFGTTETFRTTVTTTTTNQERTGVTNVVSSEAITQSLGDRIVDVSVVPFMRNISVLVTASDFKPDVTLFPFFDNQNQTNHVARVNKFVLGAGDLGFRTATANTEGVNIFNNGTSAIIGTGVSAITSNNEVFVANIITSVPLKVASANLIGQVSGTTQPITEYHHYSASPTAATVNTIVLRQDATGATNEGSYANVASSNTVTITSGKGVGQTRTMSAYAAATRTATVSANWTTTPDTTSVYSIGNLTTTRAGDVAGVYSIPSGTFRTGEKSFRLMDVASGDLAASSTSGDASFFAQGLLQTEEEVIVSTIQPTVQRTAVTDTRVSSTTSAQTVQTGGWWDPVAQTFLVAPAQHSQGIFLDKMRVCFKTKDTTVPVTLQIRPTVNGYPSSTVIYPNGTVTLTPDKIKTTTSPDFDDATKYTEFVFDAPIYLLPGEHCFVLMANSNKYEAYVAEVGKLDIKTQTQISEQPYGGSFFMSQNGSTWSADQNLDMSFRMYRKNFSSTAAVSQFTVNAPSANVAYDLINLVTSQVSMANTSVSYQFLSEKATGGLTSYRPIDSSADYAMYDGDGRRVLNAATGNTTLIVKSTMSTLNSDVSPFLDTRRFGGIFVDNTINALPLKSEDFVIAVQGSGYTSVPTVTITGGGGSGAAVTAVLTSQKVTSFNITAAGSGYTTSPTITITGGGGSGAIVSYNGENKKSGGNSKTRYVTRRVTLADGFDSGDLRVYLTAYKPSGASIHVYFKPLSSSDPDEFDNKEYVLMTELGNLNYASGNRRDYRELSFAPGTDRTATNTISYTSGTSTYNSFKTFAIKVVISGTDTTDVPKIRDFRAIALPAEVAL